MAAFLKYYIRVDADGRYGLDSIACVDGQPQPTPPGFVEWYDPLLWEYVGPTSEWVKAIVKHTDGTLVPIMFVGHLRRKIGVASSPEMIDYSVRGPRPGEIWTVGSYADLKFVGVARDFATEKFFVFEDPVDGMFVIKKDEFFDCKLSRHKQ